jgi:hypothetical protein
MTVVHINNMLHSHLIARMKQSDSWEIDSHSSGHEFLAADAYRTVSISLKKHAFEHYREPA